MSVKPVNPEPRVLDLSPLDVRFADFMAAWGGESPDPEVWLAAALASRQTGNGHICLPLGEFAGGIFFKDDSGGDLLRAPDLSLWLHKLQSCRVVGEPGETAPLILDGQRLYLNRYWSYERELIGFVKEFSAGTPLIGDLGALAGQVAGLFPEEKPRSGPDWQKVAAISAVLKRFCIICGSPGTGKTTLVFKILLLLLGQAAGQELRIALAAPTGKAANRLKESLQRWKADPGLESGVLALIPDDVFTLHRLLGSRPFSSDFRFNRDNPLPYEVVIVDEGSMVDLPLMVKLFRALPESSRLIVLGDKNQLASVEAGAVLADLCGELSVSPVSSEKTRLLEALSGETLAPAPTAGTASCIQDGVVILQKNFRFRAGSGIARISQLVNRGEGQQAFKLLNDETLADCNWRNSPAPETLCRSIVEGFKDHYVQLFESRTPEAFLARFFRFMILCAVRRGPYGVEAVNAGLERELEKTGLLERRFSGFLKRPVMITANDYRLELYNGDVGVLFEDEKDRRLHAFFPSAAGRLKRISAARLPAHETVLAMTVHKSQGSEFDRLLFVMPDHSSEILTRELVYTAITRARQQVDIFGTAEVFMAAVARRVHRSSGISPALRED